MKKNFRNAMKFSLLLSFAVLFQNIFANVFEIEQNEQQKYAFRNAVKELLNFEQIPREFGCFLCI